MPDKVSERYKLIVRFVVGVAALAFGVLVLGWNEAGVGLYVAGWLALQLWNMAGMVDRLKRDCEAHKTAREQGNAQRFDTLRGEIDDFEREVHERSASMFKPGKHLDGRD
jgi:hypothetical protein